MTKRSRLAIGLATLAIMTLGVGGFLAKAQISAIMTKSPARDRPMQRAQEEVIAAFSLIEQAMHDGDSALFLGLMSRMRRASQDDPIKAAYRDGLTARPDVHLEPIAVCVRGGNAFVVAKYEEAASRDPKSYLVRYAREDGAWKIADLRMNAAAPYRPAIYAYLPPDGGAFAYAGSPWSSIAYAVPTAADAAWKIQATRDEAFLYMRFEAAAPLPAPGSDVSADNAQRMKTGVPSGPPVMVISVTRPDDNQTLVKSSFEFQVEHRVAQRKNTGSAPAAEIRHVVAYSMVVRGDRGETLFDSSPGAFNRLIEVRDRFIDVRIPLKSFDLHGRIAPDIEVREFNALPHTMPYKVARFSP
jgi:hypothetical protein